MVSASSLECSAHADGVISKGCSPHFTICSNGIAHPMKCQAGLVYSDFTLGCDFKERVIACGGFVSPAPSKQIHTMGVVHGEFSYHVESLWYTGIAIILGM